MRRIDKFRIFNLATILLIFISFCSCGQGRQEKTVTIIHKLNLIENYKTNFNFRIEPLKYQATGNNSLKLIEIEKQLTEEKITNRIIDAFDEFFDDSEINDIYNFIQTNAFEKLFNSGGIYKAIEDNFGDISTELERISNELEDIVEIPREKFKPIPVDKEDGFYALIDYNQFTGDKNIQLEDKPSMTSKDILEVKKVYRSDNDQPEISIVFTKDGARKFYLLTKENIGKPIAIVISKRIVSMPTVNSEIIGGKANVSGDFSEEEIDKMIESLKEK